MNQDFKSLVSPVFRSKKFSLLLLLFSIISNTSINAQTNQWLTGSQNDIYRFTGSNFSRFDLMLNNTSYTGIYTNRPYFLFYRDIRSTSGLFGSYNSAHLKLHTGGTERMRISNNNGFVGINYTSPNHHLQIHGTTDYITGGTVMMNQNDSTIATGTTKTQTNHGKTARFSLTNTTSGSGTDDGALFMQHGNNLTIRNQESGDLNLKAAGLQFKFDGQNNRMIAGNSLFINLADSKYGTFSVTSTTDNGIYVRTNSSTKYGISVQVKNSESTVFESTFSGETEPHFKVTGNGRVYARRYITTLDPFPDYVFANDYNLMSYSELRNFINTKKHLPNMPTAIEIEENGADLGEINRVLVEKVEELTLYILELEERLSEVETDKSSTNTDETALIERISRLENLLEQLLEE
jgi:hypothetical protein